jgi:hypothetical protein
MVFTKRIFNVCITRSCGALWGNFTGFNCFDIGINRQNMTVIIFSYLDKVYNYLLLYSVMEVEFSLKPGIMSRLGND